jgi:hypothetical protein
LEREEIWLEIKSVDRVIECGENLRVQLTGIFSPSLNTFPHTKIRRLPMQMKSSISGFYLYSNGSVREYRLEWDETTGEHIIVRLPTFAERIKRQLVRFFYRPSSMGNISTTSMPKTDVDPKSI